MKSHFKFFRSSFIVSAIGLALGFFVGYEYSQTLRGAFTAMFLTFVLSALEISLSFDNAVVNASVLTKMTPKWRHRFMTWGMVIAVFGMRIVFPLVVVSAMAWINPWQALVLAIGKPDEYAAIMKSSHTALGGFGASFLLLVSLRYFIDPDKDVHWFKWIERPLSRTGRLAAMDVLFCTAVVVAVSRFLHEGSSTFLTSSAIGIGSFILLHALMRLLKLPKHQSRSIEKANMTMFLYLEVLDASFSFDGVVGAFAITNNLLIIAIGLGVGAMFVRSLTLMLVEKNTLTEFRFLEHGAFYAIAALAVVMLIDLFKPVPEAVTGLIGVAIIGLSLLSSLRHKKLEA
ncbi:MAG: DUF475 domain-containing protein [Bdellovibrionales bacterium]